MDTDAMMTIFVVGGICLVPVVAWLFERWLVTSQRRAAIAEGLAFAERRQAADVAGSTFK